MGDESLRLRAYLGDAAAREQLGSRSSRISDLLEDGCLPLKSRFAKRARSLINALMHRARKNVVLLNERLKQGGFVFRDRDDGYGPPLANAARLMDGFEKRSGLFIPLVFRAWVEIVGEISLMGAHPAWPYSTCNDAGSDLGMGLAVVVDPLVVEWSPKWLAPAWKGWLAGDREYHFHDRLVLDFAPDPGHKAAYSSSGSYYLPTTDVPSIDALVVNEDNPKYRRTFLEHLRDAFRGSGFPGWRGQPGEPKASLRALARGFEKI